MITPWDSMGIFDFWERQDIAFGLLLGKDLAMFTLTQKVTQYTWIRLE
jgi:hypothetical protein